jgi:hypothetical protein
VENKLEKWEVWRPISNDKCWISIDSMYIVDNILTLTYDNKKTKKKLRFCFEDGLKSIRFIYELMLLRSYIPFDHVESNFYKVLNSRYLNSLGLCSENSEVERMTHFVILGSELYIDIIASHDPQVECI